MLAVLSTGALAQRRVTYTYPAIYPFVPMQINKIHNGIKEIAEDEEAITNFNDIIDQNLSQAEADSQPWGGSFWPMNKGMIADPYESTRFGYFVELGTISWTRNYHTFQKRKNGVLKNMDKLNENQLMTLAPSEKYDILLGDYEFDLTNRMWDYMQKWGNYKENAFLSNLFLVGEDALNMAEQMVSNGWFDDINDAFLNAFQLRGSLAVEEALRLVKEEKYASIEAAMPEAIENALEQSKNYVLKKKNNLIAWWEGICHGWATAATRVMRPRKFVDFKLPDGRKLRFYPTDIKALVSLLWANSLVQDNKEVVDGQDVGGGVLYEGLRCNLKNAKTDIWGRLYDSEADPFAKKRDPRCVGVHPAKWHLGLVNLIGKQGRSFVADRKVNEAVDNHPVFAYKMKYYNPNTGRRYRRLNRNIVPIDEQDQFKRFRHPYSKYIVGVELEFKYVAWVRPNRYLNDHEGVDSITKKKVYYDLELGPNMEIVGGQWRAVKVGVPDEKRGLNHDQPDFFWVIGNNYQNFFQDIEGLEEWTDTSTVPPASWKEAARVAHVFRYQKKFSYGTGQKCEVVNQSTGEIKQISCEFEEPRPQPLVNLVNKLIELAQ